jgi:hypothetical protein
LLVVEKIGFQSLWKPIRIDGNAKKGTLCAACPNLWNDDVEILVFIY